MLHKSEGYYYFNIKIVVRDKSGMENLG